MRNEPRDWGGRVKVFWNQAMFGDVRCWVGRQPGGHLMGSMVGLGFGERKDLSGSLRRYCGRPGKKQMKNRRRKAIV